VGAKLCNTSPSGTMFEGEIVSEGMVGDCRSIRTRVRGEPRVVGVMTLELPPASPLVADLSLQWLME